MTQFVDVVEVNPLVFVNKIVEQIHNGFFVQNSIPGYPLVGLPFQIRLFETEAPKVRNVLPDEIHTVVVEGYDIMQWLLDVQDVAVQGFNVTLTGASVDNYKSITLVKVVPVSLDGLITQETPSSKPKRAKKTPTTPEGE